MVENYKQKIRISSRTRSKLLISFGAIMISLISGIFVVSHFLPESLGGAVNNGQLITGSTQSVVNLSRSWLLTPPAEAKEIVAMRTQNSKTWLKEILPDGSAKLVWQGQVGHMHYKDNSEGIAEAWKDIDTDITPSSREDYDFEMTEAEYKVYFKSKFNQGNIVRYENNGGWLEIRPGHLKWVTSGAEQLISEPRDVFGFPVEAKQNYIYWPNAYGGKLDFEWVADSSRLFKYLIIENFNNLVPLSPKLFDKVYSKDIYLELNLNLEFPDGIIMKKGEDGTVGFQNQEGRILWYFLPLHYWDSSDPIKDGLSKLEIKDNILSIRVPYTWLESAVFPVYIDPTSTYNVAASGDDIFRTNPGGGFSTTNVNLGAGAVNSASNVWHGSARFINVNIPRGSTIVSATFTLTASGFTGSSVLSKVYAEDADNAAQVTDGTDFDGRSLTAGVDWDVSTWTTGIDYDSPDITSEISTVVNRSSWSSGNAMNIFWKDDGSTSGNYITGASWDNVTYTEPRLTIEYWIPKAPGVSVSGGGLLMF